MKMSVDIPRSQRWLLAQIGRLAQEEDMQAYAVGGCVRDWILGRKGVVDLDVTVEGDALALARKASQRLGSEAIEHRQFGTATVGQIDFATCRKETYSKPAAYPKVVASTLHDDLFRRDFTINAMAVALAPTAFGRLIDPFGGFSDLRKRWLRILHPESFRDDPSRILRGVRFARRFKLSWEPATRAAAVRAIAGGLLGELNAGRMAKELDRMSQEPNPRSCLELFSSLIAEA